MVSFGKKAKIKRREIWIKVVVMFLQLYKAAGWYLDGGNAIIMIGKLDGASDDYEAAKHANLIAGLVQGV